MICHKCGTKNEDDALFCKKCGTSLIEEYKNYYKNNKEKDKTKKRKTKTKIKTKVKKVKIKNKDKNKKRESKNNKQVIIERKMGILSKITMFLLIVFIIILTAVCGGLLYKMYTDENIEVPYVINMTYEEAKITLHNSNLNIEKKEVIVEDEKEVGIVLRQNKKSGKKVSKNTVVKVEIGVLDNYVKVVNVVGMSLDEAKSTLNNNNILYTITYEETSSAKEGTIIKQYPKKNTKIQKNEKIEIIVAKKMEDEQTNENQEEKTDNESSDSNEYKED